MSGRRKMVRASTDTTIPTTYQGKLEPNHFCRGWNAKRQKYCRARAGWGTEHHGVGRCRHHGGRREGDPRVTTGRYRSIETPRIAELIAQHLEDADPLNTLPDLAAARALFQDFVERYDEATAALTAWYDTWEGKYLPIPEAGKLALLALLDEYEQLLTERDDPTEKQLADLALARSAVAFLATPQEPKPRRVLDLSDAVGHLDVISKMVHRVEQARATNAISRPELLRVMTEMGRVVQAHVSDTEVLNRIRDGWLSIRL